MAEELKNNELAHFSRPPVHPMTEEPRVGVYICNCGGNISSGTQSSVNKWRMFLENFPMLPLHVTTNLCVL